MPDALHCIASLVKISNNFDLISVGYVQKTAQKQTKTVLSAGMKTFEISKLENYKYPDIMKLGPYLCDLHTFNMPNNEGANEWAGGGATKKPLENAMKLRECRL